MEEFGDISDEKQKIKQVMNRLQGLFGGPGMGMMGGGGPAQDLPTMDTAEVVHISSLALLKMLKHGKLQPTKITRLSNSVVCMYVM